MAIGTNAPHAGDRNRLILALFEGAVGSFAIFVILGASFDAPLWRVGQRTLVVLFLIGCAFGVTTLAVLVGELRGRRAGVVQIVLLALAATFPALVAFVVLRPELSHWTLFGGLAAVVALAVAVFVVRGRHASKIAALTALAVLGVSLHATLGARVGRDAALPIVTRVNTSLYDLEVVSFANRVPPSAWDQGGLTLFGDRYLLTTGDGKLFVFRRGAAADELEIQRLPYDVPLNIADFEAAAAGLVNVQWFRVADALGQVTATGLRLFVTHHHWNVMERCWVMRVSALEGRFEEFLSPAAPLGWSTVYETAPCMPLAGGKDEPVKFGGIENGGRLALLDDEQLLITVGDHEMDGWSNRIRASQEPDGAYGKTILINLLDGSHETYTLGHRNPQGLFIAPSGTIWATEHGPQGGDELNVLSRGSNYGWPLATFGAESGTNAWPLTEKPGSHEGFALPFYSWIPSVGISAVIEVTSPKFEHWRGDLLVGSLRGQLLWRLRIREDRVVLAEQMMMGVRIRDLLEGHDGELVMWADGPLNRSIRFIEPGEAAATGEFMYRVCAGCHVPPPGLTTAVGPPLTDVVDRDVAALDDFAYSPAMRELGGQWTRERLDAFLRDPRSVVPGTTMLFTGIEDEEARRVLLDYLSSPDSRLDVVPIQPIAAARPIESRCSVPALCDGDFDSSGLTGRSKL